MKDGALWVLALVICAVMMLECVSCTLAADPANVDIDAARALTYSAEDGGLLVLARDGLYRVQGAALENGCYHLTRPKAGEDYGKAVNIWFACQK